MEEKKSSSEQQFSGKKEEKSPAVKVTKREYDLFGYIERVPLAGIRKIIAKKMVQSVQTAPQATHMDEADITDLFALREKENKILAKQGKKRTILPYVIVAIIASLKKHPAFNGNFDDEKQELIIKKYYNIGIAVDTPQGLIVPVLKMADKKSLQQIADEIVELAEKAKARKLDLAELRGGTFTLSNAGAIGGLFVTPILNYPEVAILVTGRAYDKPVVRDGKIEVRKVVPLSITFDHRVIDGADAARFMNDLKSYLEDLDVLKGEIHEESGIISPF